jgi:hypothetical protein
MVIAVLIQAVRLAPLELEDIMELDLTEMQAPEPESVVAALPEPPPEPSPAPCEPAEPPAPLPLPMDKTVILDDASSAPPAPEPPPFAASAPQPEVVEISPVKTLEPEPETMAEPDADAPKPIMIGESGFSPHRGHEALFGRSLMADYYSYESAEFSGQFKTRDGRTISIIDARETKYGRFLIYDSKNRTLRRLKEFGKYVYTIGPSVYADEPVTGTVTFLAKDDRIERFILTTDDDRMAHYPLKVHVRERDERIPVPATGAAPSRELAARTTLPPSGTGHPGVVLAHGGQCVDQGLVQGFTRSLSASGLAVLSYNPPGCDAPGSASQPMAEQAADAAAAVDFLAAREQTDPARVGLWGNGAGATAALTAAMTPGATPPAFVVCLLDDSVGPDALPGRAALSALDMPVLWLITGRGLGRWQSFVTMLEGLRDTRNRRFSIVMAPLKASRDVLDAKSDASGWVEQVAEDHARLGASWIARLGGVSDRQGKSAKEPR